MKREKIICKLKENYKYKKKYWAISGIVVFSAIFCITVVKPPKFIKDSKLYIQSLIDGDPNYEKLKEKVSLYVYKKEISLKEFEEGTIVKKEDEVKGPITASAIKSGFDSFTPSEIPKDDTTIETSTYSNNTLNNGSSSNNYYVEEKPSSNNSNNTSSSNDNEKIENKKEEFIDKSSFVGKDLMIYEGDKFDPLKNLKLSATDIDGSNITNKIVITENTVDTYKPGLYTVKANVQLSDNTKLEKDFLVRVETTALELAVVSLETESDIVKKKEEVNIDFDVKSSKDYIYVEKVVVNGKEYNATRKLTRSLFSKSDKYSTVVQAPEIAGINNLTLETIIMSDGTEVAINQSVPIEVLPEEPIVDDLVVDGNIEDDNINIDAEFTIKDIDNTLESGKVILYDENNEIIREDYVKTNELVKLKYDLLEEKVYTLRVLKYTKSRPREAELVNEVIDLRNAKAMLVNNYNLLSVMNDELTDGVVEEEGGNSSGDESIETEQDIITSSGTSDASISTEGRIKSNAGETPRKTISVTVPTAAMFTVNKDAKFIGMNINITNNGELPVDIIVNDFIDVNGNYGIKLVTDEVVTQSNGNTRTIDTLTYRRNEINLSIKGNVKKVYLGDRKVLGSLGSENLINESQKKIAKVLANQTVGLVLDGEAGTAELERNSPIQDRFTLILKIKKSTD
ncbi:pullulanase family protein [Clostridium sp. CAG:221]|uniref:pullulanase n=1 Tax=Clostridium sp. CAG:221 TaxID=1262780 RepID=UPI000339A17F|nr:pullulanase [Clostridium sp. CAG:221]CDB14299.1 pullulanase family protein [Clostridium sp. CAG:221]